MNIKLIRERVHSTIKQFVLRLSDGQAIKVPHHDFIIVGRKAVIVADENDPPRSFDLLDCLLTAQAAWSISILLMWISGT